MVACFRIGAVVLPCTEQLRANDLAPRLDRRPAALIIADERNFGELEAPPRDDAAGSPSS